MRGAASHEVQRVVLVLAQDWELDVLGCLDEPGKGQVCSESLFTTRVIRGKSPRSRRPVHRRRDPRLRSPRGSERGQPTLHSTAAAGRRTPEAQAVPQAWPPVHDDLVERAFTAEELDWLWLTDMTEDPTDEGKHYLPPWRRERLPRSRSQHGRLNLTT
jgi:hypothetical protein